MSGKSPHDAELNWIRALGNRSGTATIPANDAPAASARRTQAVRLLFIGEFFAARAPVAKDR